MWGSDEEQRAFGAIYPLWYGPEKVRDRKRAVAAMRELADAGYAPAAFALGWAYFDGDGVKRDYVAAFAEYRASAAAEYPSAEGGFGNFYLMATPKHDACAYDPVEAARWHLRAAEHGNAGSQFNLAFSYWDGRGVERDPVEAYVWASVSVHCTSIRSRPAENLRNQAEATLEAAAKSTADARIAELCSHLPQPWSEHLSYWRLLGEKAGVCDAKGNLTGG